MDSQDYIDLEKMIDDNRKAMGKIAYEGRHTAMVCGIGFLSIILIGILRVLWQMKKDADLRGERENDGVNCLGRLEEIVDAIRRG